MKEHVWEEEYVDGGSIDGYFWICYDCGASGGPVFDNNPPTFSPFYADGSGLKLSDDCEKSRLMIHNHVQTKVKSDGL